VKHVVDEYPLEKMGRGIRSIKKSAVELRNLSGGIEAVDHNADRILASIRMLEINISNMADLVVKDRRR
jgi:hypothetical protein